MQASQLFSASMIRQEFLDRRERNPALSLRAFARFLKIPASRLSEVFAGKRTLTPIMAKQIAQQLGLDQEKRLQFLSFVAQDYEKTRQRKRKSGLAELGDRQTDYKQLSVDNFYAIADWYHLALLSLVDTRGFQSDYRWMAQRLDISVLEVKAAVERLLRLELLEQKQGKFFRTHTNITTTHDIQSAALRRGHRQLLEKTALSLDEVDIALRDITSMTMAIDVKKIPQAKKVIKEFRRKLCGLLEKDSQTEVYSLCVQLVPLSKVKKGTI